MWRQQNLVPCTPCATSHYGLHGAAGLLLAKRCPKTRKCTHVVLQHRAHMTTEGGTWGPPGGARKSASETAAAAALREAREEAGVRAGQVVVRGQYVDGNHTPDWVYTTVFADLRRGAEAFEPVVCDGESIDVRWVPVEEVDAAAADDGPPGGKVLHPAFRAAWPVLRAMLS